VYHYWDIDMKRACQSSCTSTWLWTPPWICSAKSYTYWLRSQYVYAIRIRITPRICEKFVFFSLACLLEAGEVVRWKKTGDEKSRDTVPLTICRTYLGLLRPCAARRGQSERAGRGDRHPSWMNRWRSARPAGAEPPPGPGPGPAHTRTT
jgi:hypothetical protein